MVPRRDLRPDDANLLNGSTGDCHCQGQAAYEGYRLRHWVPSKRQLGIAKKNAREVFIVRRVQSVKIQGEYFVYREIEGPSQMQLRQALGVSLELGNPSIVHAIGESDASEEMYFSCGRCRFPCSLIEEVKIFSEGDRECLGVF